MSETKLFCTIPLETARLIDKVFLPANPNKMRGNDPRVSQAAKDFKAAIAAANECPTPALTPEQAAAGDMREALELVAEAFVLYGEDRGPIGRKVVAALAKAGKP